MNSLHFAASNGNTEVVLSLLEKGANLDAGTKDKDTPRHLTAYRGHAQSIVIHLEKGAPLDVQEVNEHTKWDSPMS